MCADNDQVLRPYTAVLPPSTDRTAPGRKLARVARQEHDRLGQFSQRGTAPAPALRRELLQRVAIAAVPSVTVGRDLNAFTRMPLGPIRPCPRFGQQIDGGLARSVEAQARRSDSGDHRRDVDDCLLARCVINGASSRDEK